MSILRIGMIFGGRSVEHEVSVITAHQAMAALPEARFAVVPIYIGKDGQWFTGDVLRDLKNFRDLDKLREQAEPVTFSVNANRPGLLVERRGGLFGSASKLELLPIDVAFPLVHGSHGEDGTLQGLLELANVPYVGCDVAASVLAIDKALTKRTLRAAGLPVLPELVIERGQWDRQRLKAAQPAVNEFGYPLFVKPARLGSSIGVARANDEKALATALEVAFTYDDRVIIEPAQQEIIEINCAVLGDSAGTGELRASVCEQPVSAGTLSYEDKYMRGSKGGSKGMQSAQRLIPAPISAELTAQIQSAAVGAFGAIGGCGVSRIDFLVRPEQNWFVVNEINTLPGSLSFYLFEPSGVRFPVLLIELIEQARARHSRKQRNTYTINSSLLSGANLSGSKGSSKR